jgi:hypothetical protein
MYLQSLQKRCVSVLGSVSWALSLSLLCDGWRGAAG